MEGQRSRLVYNAAAGQGTAGGLSQPPAGAAARPASSNAFRLRAHTAPASASRRGKTVDIDAGRAGPGRRSRPDNSSYPLTQRLELRRRMWTARSAKGGQGTLYCCTLERSRPEHNIAATSPRGVSQARPPPADDGRCQGATQNGTGGEGKGGAVRHLLTPAEGQAQARGQAPARRDPGRSCRRRRRSGHRRAPDNQGSWRQPPRSRSSVRRQWWRRSPAPQDRRQAPAGRGVNEPRAAGGQQQRRGAARLNRQVELVARPSCVHPAAGSGTIGHAAATHPEVHDAPSA